MMTSVAIEQGNFAKIREFGRRWWDFASAFLLLAAIFTAASRLDATKWSPGLVIVPYIAIFGVFAGLALGQSRFRPIWVVIFSALYGIYIVGWQSGLYLDQDLTWKERLLSLTDRSFLVIAQFSNQQGVTDSILFILVMAILFWILSCLAGYATTRHGNAWWSVLPTGLAAIAIHSFDPLLPQRALYLAVYLFFSLSLITRLNYLHHQSRWKEDRTMMPPNLSMDFIRFGLITVSLIVVIAWSIPNLARSIPAVLEATRPLRQSWAGIRERWEDAFASLQSTIGVQAKIYADSLELGQGDVLTDRPEFSALPPGNIPFSLRYYWRASVYNEYLDGKWSNTIFATTDFDPDDEAFLLPETDNRWEGEFKITTANYIATLYGPSQPAWFDRVGTTNLVANPDGTTDLAKFVARTTLRPQQSYQVRSSLFSPTVKQLRESDPEYPEWVTERYLQLPPTITDRTRQLALEITQDLDNPYDRAVAITNYLRENIEYQETVPRLPEGAEPVDWFLFEYQKGFCNYYATAEVVLLRLAGIPARWSIGYAQGERQADGTYLVRQLDAHAWPEVFFPGFGWVEFEPTVSQPEIIRLSGEPLLPDADRLAEQAELDALREDQLEDREAAADANLPEENASQPSIAWLPIVLGFMTVGLLVGGALLYRKYRPQLQLPSLPVVIESTMLRVGIRPPRVIREWAWQAQLTPLAKSYQEINRALNRLDNHPQVMDTPAERAVILGDMLPPAAIPAQVLVEEYQVATFSEQSGDYNTARQAGLAIRNLSIKAGLKNILARLRKPARRQTPERWKNPAG
ncbi:MAG: DUF3488 and transglutaminase-like domain-containing protein [Anaerolineales bacterium]|nr:DUF3488 and transglutaminase-like domain-containing protein [Anaerolineales bacterium]